MLDSKEVFQCSLNLSVAKCVTEISIAKCLMYPPVIWLAYLQYTIRMMQ